MLTTFRPLRGRRWSPRSVVLAVVVIGLLCLAVVSVTRGRASKPSITLQSVGSPPASIKVGGKFTLGGKVRNRTDPSRVGRITVRLRYGKTSGGGRVVARKVLKRLRGGRSTRFRVSVRIPSELPARKYRVVVCVRSGNQKPSCKQTARSLKVSARSPAGSQAPTPAGGTAFQTIDGFGSSERGFADPHVFNDGGGGGFPAISTAQQDEILDALYGELRLTRIRPAHPDTTAGPPPIGIETANDNADPLATDLARFTFDGRRLDDHADLLQRIRAKGVSVEWISPLNREPWMGVSPGTNDAAEYAEWLLAQVRRFSQRGAPLDYISVANEPSFSRNTMSGGFIRDVIKDLGPRLEAEGLLVPMVIPDDVRASDGADKAAIVLADTAARRYVGALATHLYDEPLNKLAALRSVAQLYDLPLWMSEFSMGAIGSMRPSGSPAPKPLDWALLMHDLLATYNVSAIDYLWGYFGNDPGQQFSLIDLNHDGGTYRGFTRTKVFYYFGQYSRFIRPGARRVEVLSSSDSVKATAYRRDATRTIVAINPGSAEATTTLTAADLAGVSELSQTRTGPAENWATPPSESVTGAKVTVTLPPQSVTTLSGTTG